MLGEVLCFYGHFYGKTHHIHRSSIQLLYIFWLHLMFLIFPFLFIYALFIWEFKNVHVTIVFYFGTSYSIGEKKKIKFVIVIVYLSRVLAKVMKLCAITVWLEFIYFWPILLCQCVCRDERSVHRGPVRFANMKIKHDDNKNREE